MPHGLFFSFPVRLKPKGSWTIVHDLNISRKTKECIDIAIRVRHLILLYLEHKQFTEKFIFTAGKAVVNVLLFFNRNDDIVFWTFLLKISSALISSNYAHQLPVLCACVCHLLCASGITQLLFSPLST